MALTLQTRTVRWPLREPFVIAREVMVDVPVLVLTLTDRHGRRGRAEAAGIDYEGDTPEQMIGQLCAVADRVDLDLDGAAIAALLPAGGARNALDCALVDLRAKVSGVPAWRAFGLAEPMPVVTAVTIGLGDAAETRQRAASLRDSPLLKVKVDASRPLEAVRIVREEAPEARLVVDANESWTLGLLDRSLAALQDARVELVEQPLRRGDDQGLAGFGSPIPIAADESCTDRASLEQIAGRYQAVNIKLDKCGGLSEALALAVDARAHGLDIMVGNMCGSSLAMAPAFLLAQFARWVDLDGPLLQRQDCADPLVYRAGRVSPPSPALWG